MSATRFLIVGIIVGLYPGFCLGLVVGAWYRRQLTSRSEQIVMSGHDNAAPVADAVAEFQKANGLPDPREGWHRKIQHPAPPAAPQA